MPFCFYCSPSVFFELEAFRNHLVDVHRMSMDPVVLSLMGLDPKQGRALMESRPQQGSGLVEMSETPSEEVMVLGTKGGADPTPGYSGGARALPPCPAPQEMQPLDLSTGSWGQGQGLLAIAGPPKDVDLERAAVAADRISQLKEDQISGSQSHSDGTLSGIGSLKSGDDNGSIGEGAEQQESGTTEPPRALIETVKRNLCKDAEGMATSPPQTPALGLFGGALFASGDRGLAFTPQTRMSVGSSLTPTDQRAVPQRACGMGSLQYPETPRGGRKPEGPCGTYRTSEAARRATKAYRERKVTLTHRTERLEEQLDQVSRDLVALTSKVEDLEKIFDRISNALDSD